MKHAVSFIALVLLIPSLVAASDAERERLVIGRWTAHRDGRPDRTIAFHADYSWGVERYVVSGPNEQTSIREDVRGRRWALRADNLVLWWPGDDGLESYSEKIILFRHDKIVTNTATYTREQPRK